MSRRMTLSTSSDPSARPGEQLLDHDGLARSAMPNCRPTVVSTMHQRVAQHDASARPGARSCPCERAVRTKSAFMISSTAARVVRASSASGATPSATAGRIEVAQAAVAVAEARQPAELQREQVHQHQAEPELRQRQARDGADHRDRVDQAAGLQRRDETERHADARWRTTMAAKDSCSVGHMRSASTVGHRLRACGTRCRDRASRAGGRTCRSAHDSGSSSPNSLLMRSMTCGVHARRGRRRSCSRRRCPGMTLNSTKISSATARMIGNGLQQAPHEERQHSSAPDPDVRGCSAEGVRI